MSFVHLHCHTEYSVLEASLRVPQLVKLAKENKMSAVALTDNAMMHGVIDFYLACKKNDINPIVGCEVYLTDNIKEKRRAYHRLILLCKSVQGYQNLVRIVSQAHLEGFYYKPRVDMTMIQKNAQDLIVISPGLKGPVADHLINHREKEAKNCATILKTCFGDDFYLGLQQCGLPFEDRALKIVVPFSKEHNIPLVAANDIYYAKPEDAYLKDVLSCIQTGRQIDQNARFHSPSNDQYFKTSEQMAALFDKYPEAIENTVKIAEKCNLYIDTEQVKLPQYKCPDQMNSEDYLEKLVWEGIDKKYKKRSEEIKKRVEFELAIINKMNYADYFLIIDDFLTYCVNENIPVGPGRGSAAGSIVAYAINITKIEPLKYNLLFERFLNPERVSMPDIDLDFCIKRRQEVIDYIVKKWGEDSVSQIVTFGTMQARAVIRDVGRVLGVPLDEVDYIAKLIPSAPGHYTSIEEALESVPELKETYKKNEDHKKLLEIGKVLEGQIRHTSTHAAGVVISNQPLQDIVPLMKTEEQTATQLPMMDIEKIGLLKMDILGLRNLTVMEEACELIKAQKNEKVDLDGLSLDDKPTYELLSSGHATGIFQLESRGMRQLIKDMKPSVFEDIIALLALYRPGPLGSGMVQDFISNKSGKTKVKYVLKELEPILKDTYGMIIYQEQVMQIASVIGGFSLAQADMLRRAMGKKKKSVMDEMKEVFLQGAKDKEFDVKKAEDIFELCYKFAEYGFNKSHSAAYALISYQTAYLKTHYPIEYMTALFSSVLGVTDKTVMYIEECKRMNITVLPPCINHSLAIFSIQESKKNEKIIRFGLKAIKNVGEGAIQTIIDHRPKAGYESFDQLCLSVDHKQINKRVFESLIKCGACDALGKRDQLLTDYEEKIEYAVAKIKEKEAGQVSLFSEDEQQKMSNQKLEKKAKCYISDSERLKFEKELLGFYLTGHPLDVLKEKNNNLNSMSNLKESDNGKRKTLIGYVQSVRSTVTKKGKAMFLGELEDLSGQITVMAFPTEEKRFEALKEDSIVSVTGRLIVKPDESRLICDACEGIINEEKKQRLAIKIDHLLTAEKINELQILLKENRGNTPVLLQKNNDFILTSKSNWIHIEDKIIEEIEAFAGAQNVFWT